MTDYKEEIEQELKHDRHVAMALVRAWPFLAFILLAHASVFAEYQKNILIGTAFSINICIAGASILLGIGLSFLISDARALTRIQTSEMSAASFELILPLAAFILSCLVILSLHIAY